MLGDVGYGSPSRTYARLETQSKTRAIERSRKANAQWNARVYDEKSGLNAESKIHFVRVEGR